MKSGGFLEQLFICATSSLAGFGLVALITGNTTAFVFLPVFIIAHMWGWLVGRGDS